MLNKCCQISKIDNTQKTMDESEDTNLEKNESMKIVIVFDFDHTMVDVNSDLWINGVLPTKEIPEDLIEIRKTLGWTDYMDGVFQLVHDNGISEKSIHDRMCELPFAPGMKSLIEWINKQRSVFSPIVLSDANTYFIRAFLNAHGFGDTFYKVYSNPAEFDADGRLKIRWYHNQDWCKISPANMCKGYILENHLKHGAHNDSTDIIYIGDGANDYCPSLRLRGRDHVFARKGFVLAEKISSSTDSSSKVQAHCHIYESGDEIQQFLEKKYILH